MTISSKRSKDHHTKFYYRKKQNNQMMSSHTMLAKTLSFWKCLTIMHSWELNDDNYEHSSSSARLREPETVIGACHFADVPDINYQRTLIFIEKVTKPGEYVFFRGGLDHGRLRGTVLLANFYHSAKKKASYYHTVNGYLTLTCRRYKLL